MSKKPGLPFNRTDHFANERTFLAWIRTNLGIMAFGFVVEKFSFFIKQIAFLLHGQGEWKPVQGNLQPYASLFGICLVGIGALLCLFAFFRFKNLEKQIREETYRSSYALEGFLALFVFFIGVFLLFYLILS